MCQCTGNIFTRYEMPLTNILVCEIFDVWGVNFVWPFSKSFSKEYILVTVDYTPKLVEVVAFLANDAKVVIKLKKKRIFSLDWYSMCFNKWRGNPFWNK